jgi:hypothetical protein
MQEYTVDGSQYNIQKIRLMRIDIHSLTALLLKCLAACCLLPASLETDKGLPTVDST